MEDHRHSIFGKFTGPRISGNQLYGINNFKERHQQDWLSTSHDKYQDGILSIFKALYRLWTHGIWVPKTKSSIKTKTDF